MKNQRMIRAYDSINPSPAEKQRMLDSILAEANLSDKPVKQKKAKKEPIVYTGRPTKDSRGSILGGLAACIAAFLIGAFVLIGMSRNIEDPAYTQPGETVITGTAYDEILQKYKTALEENWTVEQCQMEGICEFITGINFSALDVGYAIMDLDGNGQDELIISNGQSAVWDLYTLLDDGTPVQIHSQESGFPVHCVFENGIIRSHDFADSQEIFEYYVLKNGEFTGPEAVFRRDTSVWYYEPEGETCQVLTAEEAETKMAEYKLLELEQTSLLTLVSEEVAEKYKYPNAADYMDLIEKYRKAVDEGWDRTMCTANNMSMLTPIESEQEGLYFVMYDLNDDGVDELIISEQPYREDTDTSFIDIYTVLDGHVIQLMSLGDTSMRSLCEGGYVKDITTEQPEKYDHYVSYWRIEADQFVRDFVVYEMDGQWYTEGYRGVGAAITREEADDIVAAYPPLKLDFNPVSQNAESASLTGYDAYDYIVNKYVTALSESWPWEQCDAADISRMIMFDTTNRNDLGWCLLDLDNNGTEELVISDGTYLLDLYTLMPTDGQPGHLLSGYPKHYTLCKDGTIESREHENEINTYWRWYTLSGIDLLEQETVYYEGEKHQYSYGISDNNLTVIPEDDAGKYLVNPEKSAMELELTSFVEKQFPEVREPNYYYEPLIELYRQAIQENWNPGQCAEKGISLMIGYYGELYDTLGHNQYDLNGDGNDELIITDGNNIYDLYTIVSDETVGALRLIDATERIQYFLTTDGYLYEMGSGGAALSYHTLYTLGQRELVFHRGYMMDANENAENPWYYYDGIDKGDPCPAEEAASVMDAIHFAEISFIPFE